MRSLNRSLPRSPKRRTAQPPEHLVQAFKTAALTVTNLYKTAVSEEAQARQAGYQDALDDVLAFLDKENLGLGDGEGWRVRQWATERLDGSLPAHNGSDTDDERGETEKRVRSTSPVVQRKQSREILPEGHPSRSTSPAQTASVPEPIIESAQPTVSVTTKSDVFSFRSSIPYPQDIDMQTADTTSTGTSTSDTPSQPQTTTSTPAVRVEVVPRGSKATHRNGNHVSRHNTRSATTTRSIGSGAGSKRRIELPDHDYFNINNILDGKDGFGGTGKRSRFT